MIADESSDRLPVEPTPLATTARDLQARRDDLGPIPPSASNHRDEDHGWQFHGSRHSMGPASAADLAAADQLRLEEQAAALADGRTALDRLGELERAMLFEAPDDADLRTPNGLAYDLNAIAAALGITPAHLVGALGISPHTATVTAESAPAQPELAQIARVVRAAREGLIPGRVPTWLSTPLLAFDGATPLALMLSNRASALANSLDDALHGGVE